MKKKRNLLQERFISFLREKMREKGIGLRELSRNSKISPSYLSRFMSFNANVPSNDKLVSIAEALGIDPSVILLEAGRTPVNDAKTFELIRSFGELDDEDKQDILRIIEKYRAAKRNKEG